MLLLRSSALLVGLWLLLDAGAARAEPPPPRAPVAGTGAAAAPDGDTAAKQAMELHDEAWSLYEQGHYRAAIEKLEAALRKDPGGKVLVYNLALLHEKLGNLDTARGYYRRYLDMDTDPKGRARVQAILRRLEGAARETDPGAISPSSPSAAARGPLREPAPAAPRPPRPVRPWVIATGTAAAVAFLTGGSFGLAALARNPGADARTGPGVSVADLEAQAHRAHAYAMVADTSLILSAAAAGTALVLYLATPRADQTSRLAVGPGLLRVSY